MAKAKHEQAILGSVNELEEFKVSLSEELEQAMQAGDIARVKALREQIEDTRVELEVSKKVEYGKAVAGLAAEVQSHKDELRSAESVLVEKARALRDVLKVKADREVEFVEAGRKRDAMVSLLRGALSTYGTAKFPIPPGLIGEESSHAKARAFTEVMREFGYGHDSDLLVSYMGYKDWSFSQVEGLITKLERNQ